MIDRKDFMSEVLLRKYLNKAITTVQERKKKAKNEKILQENALRSLIQELINETKVPDPEEAPHESTGINVLEDLLKKIIPIIEIDFKKLTTNEEQRLSYRGHVLQAIKNSLAPPRAMDMASADGGEVATPLSEAYGDDDLNIKISDDDAFIDIDPGSPKSEKEVEKDDFSIEGEDETGRDMAFDTFKRIESNIVDSWDILYSDEDKELFYDYLITNIKLYFDKFEDELKINLPEPTTPEYEQETAAVEEPPAEELPPEEAIDIPPPPEEELGL